MEIKNHFSPSEKVVTPQSTKRAKQEFKADTDLNTIMRKFQVTQSLDHVRVYQGRYGDATPLDYHNAMTVIADANSMFADLPSSLRNEFDNDPSKFLSFVQNPDNYDKARELGIELADKAKAAAEAAIIASQNQDQGGEEPAVAADEVVNQEENPTP